MSKMYTRRGLNLQIGTPLPAANVHLTLYDIKVLYTVIKGERKLVMWTSSPERGN